MIKTVDELIQALCRMPSDLPIKIFNSCECKEQDIRAVIKENEKEVVTIFLRD